MANQQKSENVCPKCGKAIVSNASYCVSCGARVFSGNDGGQTADPYVGTIIDNTFEIESILGTGSMGIVYKARHRALDCYVALKVLRQDFIQDRVVLARFQREAQAASSLSHPNVIRILDYGKTCLNAPYIAMECLEGRELADLVLDKQNPLTQKRICAIALQTCQALSAAHAANIIHRDLKPANIIIIQQEGYELVKVLDFGIAKIVDVEGEGLTREGAVCGTPAFMSPEQVLGRQVTPASDLFSLGSIMYYMLTGKLPFQGANMVDMAQSILTTVPTAPSCVRIDRWVDPHLEEICMKALQKEPENRFASAIEMGKALEAAYPQISDIATARPKLVIASNEYTNDPNAETCCSIMAMDEDDEEGGTVVEMPAMEDPADTNENRKPDVSNHDMNPMSSAISIVGEALSDVFVHGAEKKELAPGQSTTMYSGLDREDISSRMEESREEILARRKKMMLALVILGCFLCIICLLVLFIINSVVNGDDESSDSEEVVEEVVLSDEAKKSAKNGFVDSAKNGFFLVDLKTQHVVGFNDSPEVVSQYELAAERAEEEAEEKAEEEAEKAKKEAADVDDAENDSENDADEKDVDKEDEEAAEKTAAEKAAAEKKAESEKKAASEKKSSNKKSTSNSSKSGSSKSSKSSSKKSSGSAKLEKALKMERTNRKGACEIYKSLLKDSSLSQSERIKVQGKVRSCGRVTI